MITAHHVTLALAAIALVGVVAAQDYLYAPLRQETISSGLTGPYHWWLDASYLVLAIALVMAVDGQPVLTHFFGVVAAIALLFTAVTNTFSGFVDKITGGQHSLWHTRFTLVTFVSALSLEVSANHSPGLWVITVSNVITPAGVYLLSSRSDYAEKVGVLLICAWLVAWAL